MKKKKKRTTNVSIKTNEDGTRFINVKLKRLSINITVLENEANLAPIRD